MAIEVCNHTIGRTDHLDARTDNGLAIVVHNRTFHALRLLHYIRCSISITTPPYCWRDNQCRTQQSDRQHRFFVK